MSALDLADADETIDVFDKLVADNARLRDEIVWMRQRAERAEAAIDQSWRPEVTALGDLVKQTAKECGLQKTDNARLRAELQAREALVLRQGLRIDSQHKLVRTAGDEIDRLRAELATWRQQGGPERRTFSFRCEQCKRLLATAVAESMTLLTLGESNLFGAMYCADCRALDAVPRRAGTEEIRLEFRPSPYSQYCRHNVDLNVDCVDCGLPDPDQAPSPEPHRD